LFLSSHSVQPRKREEKQEPKDRKQRKSKIHDAFRWGQRKDFYFFPEKEKKKDYLSKRNQPIKIKKQSSQPNLSDDLGIWSRSLAFFLLFSSRLLSLVKSGRRVEHGKRTG
jgi:hypothetical protein